MQINPNSKRIDDQSSLLYQNIIKYIDAEAIKMSFSKDFKCDTLSLILHCDFH